MSTYRDQAVVLGSYKFGEADRVVVLLTQNHGKVRAVAKGVRKTKSSIGARLEPMSHVDISLRTGRQLDTVDQVKLVHTHSRLRDDFERLRQGLSMLEAVNKITPDRDPVPQLFTLLSRALHPSCWARSFGACCRLRDTRLNLMRVLPVVKRAASRRLMSLKGECIAVRAVVACPFLYLHLKSCRKCLVAR